MTAKDDGRPQDSAANPVTVLNDAFRRNPSSGAMVATAGVIGLGAGALPAILEMVRTFDAFTPDNDPYGEHDFGVLEWQGHRLFWKIDCFDKAMVFGSPDPGDPDVTTRVLTIMLAEEW